MMRYWNLYAKYLKPMRRKAVLLAALIFIDIGLQLVNPQLVSHFIDSAIAHAEVGFLTFIALAFLGVSLLAQVVGVAATYLGEDIGWRATNQLRADLAQHCLELDMSFHHAHTPGEMIERIDGDVTHIANFFSQLAIRILGNAFFLISALVVLALQDWRASVALIAYAVAGFVGLSFLRRIAVPHWKAAREASAALFGFVEEQLSGTEDIRSSGAGAYVVRNLFKFNKGRLDKELQSSSRSSLITIMWIGLYILGQAVSFISGYSLFRQGLITVGSVYLIVYYTHLVFQRLLDVATEVQNMQQAAASIERVDTLLATESKIKTTAARAMVPAGPLSIVFEGVTFSYDETEPVLRDVTFRLPPGKVLGVLGRTGSGKTTLTRLLFRLYDPGQGAIRLGVDQSGVQAASDIREFPLDDLHRRIGLVTQNVQLFHATVRDNLTFFDPRIPDTKI
ncbi:MAG TPA: ABC transporter ATP-binding protein, partial [Anaerolineae bacterium]|nr:ABC transporter ATP-binding protein [Anaerolineae bacterium]